MIPTFDDNGYLPLGIHLVEWEEFNERFNYNPTRLRLMKGLKLAMTHLKAANCKIIYVDGSFITNKEKPGDFDACWEENGVDVNELNLLAPTLYNFALRRVEQKTKYKGEIFPANYPANDYATPYIDFFQFDTRRNICKGIIAIDLTRWAP
jgi:hypothetical protein